MTEESDKIVELEKIIKDLEKDLLRSNGAQVECFVRINSLEKLLLQKGIFSEKEYEDSVKKNIETFGAAMEAALKARIENNIN